MPFLMPSQQCRRTEGIWRPSIGLTILCFYSKTGFWPSYCQISTDLDKICTHLLLYGIHLWANLDCDRHMGGSRPNQNDYVFCNTCKCCCEKFRNFVAWAEPDKTAFFCVLGDPSTLLSTPYRKQFYPKPVVPMESRDSEGVPFASLASLWPGIWQKVPESGPVTFTEWLCLNTVTLKICI